MKHYISAEDEQLHDKSKRMSELQETLKGHIARGEGIPPELTGELGALSEERATLMTAPRTYTCEGCGAERPRGDESFLIVREVIIYDAVAQAPRHHVLEQEVYKDIKCPNCVAGEDVAATLRVLADSAPHLVHGHAKKNGIEMEVQPDE